jgi:hypothetical protein
MQEFPNSDHDDGPDALDMAIQLGIELQKGQEDSDDNERNKGFIEFPEIPLEAQWPS